jgi:hypothetical protein
VCVLREVKFHAHLASQFSAPLSECDAGPRSAAIFVARLRSQMHSRIS